MNTKNKMLATLMVSIIAIAVAFPAVTALTEGEEDPILIGAVITGEGLAPEVKAQWELYDEDPFTAGTQVWPECFGTKMVYAVIVVRSSLGNDDIGQVHADVYHPDGSFKYQKEAVEVTDPAEIEALKQAALGAGLITPEMAADIDWEIEKNVAKMFISELPMDYHQMPGEYTVVTWATSKNTGAQSDHLDSYFYYHSLHCVAIDFFGGIDFGPILPCKEKIVAGDEDMGTPNRPTIQSGCNDPVWIGVHFKPMVGVEKHKEILEFDAEFDPEYIGNDARKVYLSACEDYVFPDPLPPCNTRQIDLSVHAPDGTPADSYVGHLNFWIQATAPS